VVCYLRCIQLPPFRTISSNPIPIVVPGVGTIVRRPLLRFQQLLLPRIHIGSGHSFGIIRVDFGEEGTCKEFGHGVCGVGGCL